ncbi:hypothetical protein OH687_12805 [Burkholderia anthina]|nr:hypothetical protein OH687_12805 [Burkholderia anthina]
MTCRRTLDASLRFRFKKLSSSVLTLPSSFQYAFAKLVARASRRPFFQQPKLDSTCPRCPMLPVVRP